MQAWLFYVIYFFISKDQTQQESLLRKLLWASLYVTMENNTTSL